MNLACITLHTNWKRDARFERIQVLGGTLQWSTYQTGRHIVGTWKDYETCGA